MSASDVAAWVSLAVGLVALIGGGATALAFAWKSGTTFGTMSERLRATEDLTRKLHSEFPKAHVEIARLDERSRRASHADPLDERQKRASHVDPDEAQ